MIKKVITFLDLIATIQEKPVNHIDWLKDSQKQCLDMLAGRSLPDTENWRYIDWRGLQKQSFLAREQLQLSIAREADGADNTQLQVNVRQSIELPETIPQGLQITPFRQLDEDTQKYFLESLSESYINSLNPLILLNISMIYNGLFIRVKKGASISQKIRIRYSAIPGSATFFYLLMQVEEGAEACLIEQECVSALSWENSYTDIRLAEGARLAHTRLQVTSGEGWQLAGLQAQIARQGEYKLRQYSTGSYLRLNDINIETHGQGASADLQGASVASQRQQIANLININHVKPGGTSNTTFKAVANGKGKSVLGGHILIAEGAVKTLAELQSSNLLLSDQAEIDTKPALEIYADDVSCAHGATVGQLDSEALYYLCSRGISEEVAKQMLIFGFIGSILDNLDSLDQVIVRENFMTRMQHEH